MKIPLITSKANCTYSFILKYIPYFAIYRIKSVALILKLTRCGIHYLVFHLIFICSFFCGTISPKVPYGIPLMGFEETKKLVQVYFETPVTLLSEWRGPRCSITRIANHSHRSFADKREKHEGGSTEQSIFLVPRFWAVTLIILIQAFDTLRQISKKAKETEF